MSEPKWIVNDMWPTVDELAQRIRYLNGSNTMGAGQLAELLLEWMQSRNAGVMVGPLGDGAERRVEAVIEHQRKRIKAAQEHDAEQAKPKLTHGVKGTPALAGLADYLRRDAQQTLNNWDREPPPPEVLKIVERTRAWADAVDALGVKASDKEPK